MNALVFAIAAACFQWDVSQYAVSAPNAVVVSDVNGDGAPDIITSGNQVNELNAFSLFVNRGDGTFAAERLITTGFGERIETIADLDRDGVPDLLASDYWSNGIVVHRGRGELAFDPGSPYPTATHGGPSFVTDFDGDGTPDLVSLSFGSGNPVRLHLFHGNGDGTFAPKQTFTTDLANGATPSLRSIGGALEILVSERGGDLGLIRYADGGVTTSRLAAGPGFDLAALFADVNGDGIADVIDTNNDATSLDEPIFVTLANGDGTFGERRRLAHPRHLTLPALLRAADVDGDGNIDLVVADFQGTTLYWYRGDGSGNFAEGAAIDARGPVNAFTIADVNGDSVLDLVTINADQTLTVLINRGGCRPPRRRAAKH